MIKIQLRKLRKLLGPELIIVVLTMTKKNMERRLRQRHKKDKHLVDMLMVKYRIYYHQALHITLYCFYFLFPVNRKYD